MLILKVIFITFNVALIKKHCEMQDEGRLGHTWGTSQSTRECLKRSPGSIGKGKKKKKNIVYGRSDMEAIEVGSRVNKTSMKTTKPTHTVLVSVHNLRCHVCLISSRWWLRVCRYRPHPRSKPHRTSKFDLFKCR